MVGGKAGDISAPHSKVSVAGLLLWVWQCLMLYSNPFSCSPAVSL
jgi:hypothetical protein